MRTKKKAYTFSCFKGNNSKTRGDPSVTNLLNLPDVRDVSANADALKAYLDRSFDLVKEPSEKYRHFT